MRLKLTINDQIAIISMDDGKVNAMDNDWFRDFLSLLDEVEDSTAYALILAGREKVFSGGLNIKWLPGMTSMEQVQFKSLFPETMKRLYNFPKPTIAAITGHAMAGGCVLACACDRRLALNGYRMGMNEVLINMTIPSWIIEIISNVIPKPYVQDVLNHAEILDMEQARSMGVIRELFDNSEVLLTQAIKLAESYSALSLPDFARTKMSPRKPT